MAELFKKVFQVELPEGGVKTFETQAEAMDYLRRPKVLEALNAITGNDAELGNWIYENQEMLEEIFSAGTIQRVTKAERKKIDKAFEALKSVANDLPKDCAFIIENAEAFQESFRWPAVKRLDEAAKASLITTSLMGLTENDKELTEWIIKFKEQIFVAFDAGKIKREVAPSAAAGLEIYRAKKAEEKVLKEALKEAQKTGEGVEEAQAKLDAFTAAWEAEKAAAEAAKKAAKA